MQSTSNLLWRENQDLAQAALHTGFVQQLCLGVLPSPIFEAYIAQDVFFLESFSRSYEAAIEKAARQSPGVLDVLQHLKADIQSELQSIHKRVQSENLVTVQPESATAKYTTFLEQACETEDLAGIIAAMTPCNRLYAFLGQTLKARQEEEKVNRYSEWIDFYSSAAFTKSAEDIEMVLDKATDVLHSGRVNSLYRDAMELEVKFFEAHS